MHGPPAITDWLLRQFGKVGLSSKQQEHRLYAHSHAEVAVYQILEQCSVVETPALQLHDRSSWGLGERTRKQPIQGVHCCGCDCLDQTLYAVVAAVHRHMDLPGESRSSMRTASCLLALGRTAPAAGWEGHAACSLHALKIVKSVRSEGRAA